MSLQRLIRYFRLLRLFLKSPFERPKYAKKKGIFNTIGNDCYLATWNFGTEPHLISFGDNVFVATGVRFINHDMSVAMISNILFSEPNRIHSQGKITIGSNVFIGADSILLPGITIADNVVIGAGSVVTKNIETNIVAAGVPARFIKSFDEFLNEKRTID